MAEAQIQLDGLTKFDRLDLGDQPGIQYKPSPIGSGAYGEVATLTVLVTMSLVSTLAAYLLRKHGDQEFDEEVVIHHPDGRIEKRRVRYRVSASEAPNAQIIRQIQVGSGLGLGGG